MRRRKSWVSGGFIGVCGVCEMSDWGKIAGKSISAFFRFCDHYRHEGTFPRQEWEKPPVGDPATGRPFARRLARLPVAS
jgi:hypothetical protein